MSVADLQKCRTIGIPGAGKTHRAISIARKVKSRGYSLMHIGFCTFTRAARREAAQRAAEVFDTTVERLEKQGWFRTIHSACMRLLGLPKGSIVNFDQLWIHNAMGDRQISLEGNEEDGESWTSQWKGKSPAVIALSLWDVARNRLVPFQAVYDHATYRMGAITGLRSTAEAREYIQRYEKAKVKDGRVDFCDCILRYAGRKMTLDGPEKVQPSGEIPELAAWIFDESQDTSPLLDLAAQRLASGALYWYLFGDREQGIYSWSGGDPNSFMRWDVAHEEYLHKTWRCASKIIQMGLRLIYKNDDLTYGLRSLAVEPRCVGGKIEMGWVENVAGHVGDPHDSVLVMARTNRDAFDLQNSLSRAGIPWKSARSPRRFPSSAFTATVDAFTELAGGGVLDGEGWRRIVGAVPAALLVKGTKTRFLPALSREEADFITMASMAQYGGTDALKEYIASGRWTELVSCEEQQAAAARKKWGTLVDDPRVIVSTIHGTKGCEADRVLLSTAIGGPVLRNLRTPEGQQEERRVWYVGATRSRDHLVLLKGRQNYQDIYDCME